MNIKMKMKWMQWIVWVGCILFSEGLRDNSEKLVVAYNEDYISNTRIENE
jgi:hypothetical protein